MKEITEDEWGDYRQAEDYNRAKNQEPKSGKSKDRSQFHSFSQQDEAPNQKGESTTPGISGGLSKKLELNLKNPNRSPSKNNSVVSHSARSHMKLTSPKNPHHLKEKGMDGVPKDKLFSENEYPNYGHAKNFKSKNRLNGDWEIQASKPGVDVSQFYGPNSGDDVSPPQKPNATQNRNDQEEEVKVPNLVSGRENTPNKILFIEETRKSGNNRTKNQDTSSKADLSRNDTTKTSKRFNLAGDKEMADYEPFPHLQATSPVKAKENTYSGLDDESSENINHHMDDEE